MKIYLRNMLAVAALAVLCSFMAPRAAVAAQAIAIDGVVYDAHNNPAAGVPVSAWCGGVNFFGGSNTTDSHGHYLIRTNSDDCPLGTELTVSADTNADGLSDGARHTQTHTLTTINIYLGTYSSVPVPEYDGVGAGFAALAGIAIVGFARRARPRGV